MDKSFTKGEYLEVNTKTGEKFGGYFYSQSKDGNRLSLFDVIQFPKGDLLDLYHFTMNDIKLVEKVEKNPDYEKIADLSLYGKTISNKASCDSTKFIFINQVDNKYNEAMSDIKNCKTISMGTDGAEMGRKCKLSILSLSTLENIYIFDVQAMQENVFKNGLRDVLQSEDILKIIHNSRRLSDCLYHKHNVILKNIFDTQAADVLIQNRNTGLYPKEVRKLVDCLNIYLGCGDYKITEKIDIIELTQRPIQISVKENVSNNVVFLGQLHKALLEEIMKPFIKGSNFYVDCQRQCNDSDAWYLCSQDNKVPKNFVESFQTV